MIMMKGVVCGDKAAYKGLVLYTSIFAFVRQASFIELRQLRHNVGDSELSVLRIGFRNEFTKSLEVVFWSIKLVGHNTSYRLPIQQGRPEK
jgi:hypothetical protein